MIESKLLHQSECMRIEYYYKLNRENRQLAFVFSSLGSRTLNGNVNGGDFLIENGFDVVNFNSNGLEWFQETPKEIFSSVRALDGYERRVAMGSSMGGFAAIAFSKLLECDLVLAYAPQSDALMQFDGRFADIVRNLHWVYPVSELADSKCKYFVVYDNKNALDTMHAQHLRSILQHGYSEITIPFAGHAVVFYLLELGLLKQVTLSVLTGRPLPLQDLGGIEESLGNISRRCPNNLPRRSISGFPPMLSSL